MLACVLNYRGSMRVEASEVIPGHWLYESIKAQVLEERKNRTKGRKTKANGA
jgi:hypothetical protein